MKPILKQLRDDVAQIVGAIVIGAVIIGLAALLIYIILGSFSDAGRHWFGVVMVFAVLAAYALGLREGKAHRAGIERGVDIKVAAFERTHRVGAIHESPRPAPSAAAAPDWNALLPPRMDAARIVTRHADDAGPIDL